MSVSDSQPSMSVILPTDTWETILPVIERLKERTPKDQIELVVVLPSAHSQQASTESLTHFAAVRIAKVDSVVPLGPARAAGVRAATAPLVFIGETHSYPRSGMMQALIDALKIPWMAGPPSEPLQKALQVGLMGKAEPQANLWEIIAQIEQRFMQWLAS